MRAILEHCIELDRHAFDTYTALAASCTDAELATCFGRLAEEEDVHAGWWSELLAAWEAGLVPDIADEHRLLERLEAIRTELTPSAPIDCAEMSVDDALDLAARYEFHLLDPVFGELLDLVRPGSGIDVPGEYSQHVLRLVDLVERRYTRPGTARLLASVLRAALRDQGRLLSAARRDGLTGLHGREDTLVHLTQWLSWSQRYGRPLGVVLLDVDRLKLVNDVYGTDAGDRAIGAVATALQRSVRASDTVGRFGGDSFLLVAPETDGAELELLMGRLVSKVDDLALDEQGAACGVSVSAGAAWAPGGVPVTPEDLIAQADRSLYEAKTRGRNRAGGALSAGAV
jgi:diguanylate cyclase (GGDEF)-like protein